jgi:very-short-patch-repair endonuclease
VVFVMFDRKTMLSRAATMRKAPTEAERRLWWRLRNSQIGGHKFRRQFTVGERIVDFFCPAKGLIVELDGDTHDAQRDAVRDAQMQARFGFATLRFANHEVMDNLDGVLETLLSTLDGLPDRWEGHTTPAPSSEEEGRSN